MSGLAAVDAEIDRRLTAAAPPGVAIGLTSAVLRGLAADYLNFHDDVILFDATHVRRPHWNVWLSDAREPLAMFAVLVFRPDGVEFFCGAGSAADVHAACEAGPAADTVYAVLREQFPIAEEPLRLDRPTAEAWLGRPRPW
jgi:hypothetical protein